MKEVKDMEKEKVVKPKRRKYGEYVGVKVGCKTTTKMLGGTQSGNKPPEYTHIFRRDEDGDIIITGDMFHAMLRDSSDIVDLGPAEARRIRTQTVKVNLNGEGITGELKPIAIPGRGGVGQNFFECVPPGATFKAEFLVPTMAVSLSKFKKWVEYAGKWNGVGAYRKGTYGHFKVESFEEFAI